jgi:hypothetical protein
MANRVAIPMFDSSSFKISVTLDLKEYRLSFAWNSRGQYWSMSIADANGVMLRAGIRLVVSYPLNIQHTDPRLPQGLFMIIDSNEKTAMIEPGRNDFVAGRKLELIYRSRS